MSGGLSILYVPKNPDLSQRTGPSYSIDTLLSLFKSSCPALPEFLTAISELSEAKYLYSETPLEPLYGSQANPARDSRNWERKFSQQVGPQNYVSYEEYEKEMLETAPDDLWDLPAEEDLDNDVYVDFFNTEKFNKGQERITKQWEEHKQRSQEERDFPVDRADRRRVQMKYNTPPQTVDFRAAREPIEKEAPTHDKPLISTEPAIMFQERPNLPGEVTLPGRQDQPTTTHKPTALNTQLTNLLSKVKVSAKSTVPKSDIEGLCWQYIDLKGVVQGPFNNENMKNWHARKYLKPSLPIKLVSEEKYFPISDRFFPNTPFESLPFTIEAIGKPGQTEAEIRAEILGKNEPVSRITSSTTVWGDPIVKS
ncbi:hypothetical protein BLNAU_13066 [Blattamonas nauphoetae]|uniref:GYF domain-containing protein n=1 Tax=Blattamonas nauphoetae TaxID=2049346 RepID=A0ABQ9XHP8_9EUKA|nr:hypothetical protein BLNAU_13066 [Blattamonas nauphoetae]